MRRRKGDFEPLGGLVPRVLEDLGLAGATRVMQVAECWADAVGPEIAAHSRPSVFKEDQLEVTVDSSVWCQQLQLRAPEILSALRAVLGERAPSDLWFRVG